MISSHPLNPACFLLRRTKHGDNHGFTACRSVEGRKQPADGTGCTGQLNGLSAVGPCVAMQYGGMVLQFWPEPGTLLGRGMLPGTLCEGSELMGGLCAWMGTLVPSGKKRSSLVLDACCWKGERRGERVGSRFMKLENIAQV